MDRARILLKQTDRRTDKKIPIYPQNFVFNYTPRNEIAMGIMFKLVRQSVRKSCFLLFISVTSLKTAAWNFVKFCRDFGHNVQICIISRNFNFNFLWEFRSFISVLLNLKVCSYIKQNKEQFVTLTPLQMLHGLQENLISIQDTLCRCAYYPKILIPII